MGVGLRLKYIYDGIIIDYPAPAARRVAGWQPTVSGVIFVCLWFISPVSFDFNKMEIEIFKQCGLGYPFFHNPCQSVKSVSEKVIELHSIRNPLREKL